MIITTKPTSPFRAPRGRPSWDSADARLQWFSRVSLTEITVSVFLPTKGIGSDRIYVSSWKEQRNDGHALGVSDVLVGFGELLVGFGALPCHTTRNTHVDLIAWDENPYEHWTSDLGGAFGTAKASVGIMAMGIRSPELLIKNSIPVVMAGVLGIYGLMWVRKSPFFVKFMFRSMFSSVSEW